MQPAQSFVETARNVDQAGIYDSQIEAGGILLFYKHMILSPDSFD